MAAHGTVAQSRRFLRCCRVCQTVYTESLAAHAGTRAGGRRGGAAAGRRHRVVACTRMAARDREAAQRWERWLATIDDRGFFSEEPARSERRAPAPDGGLHEFADIGPRDVLDAGFPFWSRAWLEEAAGSSRDCEDGDAATVAHSGLIERLLVVLILAASLLVPLALIVLAAVGGW